MENNIFVFNKRAKNPGGLKWKMHREGCSLRRVTNRLWRGCERFHLFVC